MSADGMIRRCPLYRVCEDGVTPPKRSVTSVNASALPRMTALVDMALLENCVREDLNEKAPRVMAVLRPLRVVIDNYPEGRVEEFDCPYHPQKPEMGSRKVPFSRDALHRTGRFHGESAQEVFPAGSREEKCVSATVTL